MKRKLGIYAIPAGSKVLSWFFSDTEGLIFPSSKRKAQWYYQDDDAQKLDFYQVTVEFKKL